MYQLHEINTKYEGLYNQEPNSLKVSLAHDSTITTLLLPFMELCENFWSSIMMMQSSITKRVSQLCINSFTNNRLSDKYIESKIMLLESESMPFDSLQNATVGIDETEPVVNCELCQKQTGNFNKHMRTAHPGCGGIVIGVMIHSNLSS